MRPLPLFLYGDVMTGRGIGQVLPRPGAPALHESYVQSASAMCAWPNSSMG
jgi:poly-gamma-glutamate synthesis protein (capsule biosynthesis protein)